MAALIAIRNGIRLRRSSQALAALASFVAAAGLTGVLGCAKDSTAPTTLPPAQLYWALELNQHAILLALTPQYDTVQLTATPTTALGAPFATTGAVTYKALDSTVSVSATGLVTAHYLTAAGHPVRVAATLQDPTQGIIHTDTARIVVTAAVAPAVASYSLQPVSPDSAKRALDFVAQPTNRAGFPWPVRAVNTTGTAVCGPQRCTLPVYYQSSRPQVATIDSVGRVVQQDTGHVVFRAQTLAYGQVLRDSVAFQIGYKLSYTISMVLSLVLGVLTLGFFAPKKLVLGVGAVITFCDSPPSNIADVPNAQPVDIVFDHPESVDSASCSTTNPQARGRVLPPTGSGNIAPFGGDTTSILRDVACRRFPVAGVYHYHSTLFPSDTYEIDIQQDPQ